MDRFVVPRRGAVLALALALALPAGLAAAGSPTLSTNQTLQQVLGNHQSLPGLADPGLRLQQDLSKQGAARAGRQQSIESSGAAQQQMRQRDLDAQRRQQLQYRQQQLEGEEYRYFQQLETKGR